MFSNIGKKLKIVAIGFCVLGFIASFTYGIFVMASGANNKFLLGAAVIILGLLGSWICSLLIYAFGEIYLNLKKISKSTSYEAQNDVLNAKSELEKDVKDFINDKKINEEANIKLQCPICGENLSYVKDELISKKEIKCPECDSVIYEKKENN